MNCKNKSYLLNTGFVNDEEEMASKDLQSKEFSSYMTSNYDNNQGRDNYYNSLNHLGMFANNKSSYGSYIDTESKLKNSSMTNNKEKNSKILNSRPFGLHGKPSQFEFSPLH